MVRARKADVTGMARAGKADVTRTGTDITIMATLLMAARVLQAPERLAKDRTIAGVIDYAACPRSTFKPPRAARSMRRD
jgi:transketolase C-terminal domain/subunit